MHEKPIHILLVGRDEEQAHDVRRIVQDDGNGAFVFTWAAQLDEAVGEVAGGDVDVVLLDLKSSHDAGMDTLARIRSACPDIPVIALSQRADEGVAAEAARLGFQDCLAKDRIGADILLRAVRYAVERAHARKALAAGESELREARAAARSARRRVQQLSTRDDLTGAWNRRHFMHALERECRRLKRYARPFAVMMVDVDDFKQINDTCGHAFGDAALKEATRALCAEVRDIDVVARYAGDEFMVLMPDTSGEDAVSVAQRIRTRMARAPVRDGEHSAVVTFSIGVVAGEQAIEHTPDRIVHFADTALYTAKQAGRNCVRRWEQVSHNQKMQSLIESRAVARLQRKLDRFARRAEGMFVADVLKLAQDVDAADPYAEAHSKNVAHYATGIARTLGMPDADVETLRRAAMIHDLGRVGVPEAILSKTGTLTPEQRLVVEQHVVIGVRILTKLHFLERETPIVRYHHERWNGGGYPDGISGLGIPVGARVLSVADTLDAMTCDRVYRKALTLAEAIERIRGDSGVTFDPEVVGALVQWIHDVSEAAGSSGDMTARDLLTAAPSPGPT